MHLSFQRAKLKKKLSEKGHSISSVTTQLVTQGDEDAPYIPAH